MKNISIKVDGVEIELTKEQVKKINANKNKNAFGIEIPYESESCIIMCNISNTLSFIAYENNDKNQIAFATGSIIPQKYLTKNKYRNIELVQKFQDKDNINRLLRLYALQYNALVQNEDFSKHDAKYFIGSENNKDYHVVRCNETYPSINTIFFSDYDVAQNAIQEVIYPFYGFVMLED